MLPGETIRSGADPKCCGAKLELKVCRSNAGFYVGTICPQCGPYTRESEYYRTWVEAQNALTLGNVRWRQ